MNFAPDHPENVYETDFRNTMREKHGVHTERGEYVEGGRWCLHSDVPISSNMSPMIDEVEPEGSGYAVYLRPFEETYWQRLPQMVKWGMCTTAIGILLQVGIITFLNFD